MQALRAELSKAQGESRSGARGKEIGQKEIETLKKKVCVCVRVCVCVCVCVWRTAPAQAGTRAGTGPRLPLSSHRHKRAAVPGQVADLEVKLKGAKEDKQAALQARKGAGGAAGRALRVLGARCGRCGGSSRPAALRNARVGNTDTKTYTHAHTRTHTPTGQVQL